MGMTTHITKTWFDGEKVVTQDIPEADFYRPSMTKDEALKLALEALKTIDEAMPFPVAKLAQAAIKEALAQPEQERYFCQRCGKPVNLTTIHTCTPPRENT